MGQSRRAWQGVSRALDFGETQNFLTALKFPDPCLAL